MSFTSAADVPLLVSSPNAASERRVSPAWSIAHFKSRLEPITGIPASSQTLVLRLPGGGQPGTAIEAEDEESTLLASFPLQPYAEIYVHDTRPAGARTDFTDLSSVEKYQMPEAEYEARTDSVLAWKRAQKLGRFNPEAPSVEEQKVKAIEREVDERNLTLNSRCRLLPPSPPRHGVISYIGPIPSIPGPKGAPWVGIALDEPTGKNDGSAPDGTRYFTCPRNSGVFVRPDRVEAGAQFGVVGLDDDDEDMEEI